MPPEPKDKYTELQEKLREFGIDVSTSDSPEGFTLPEGFHVELVDGKQVIKPVEAEGGPPATPPATPPTTPPTPPPEDDDKKKLEEMKTKYEAEMTKAADLVTKMSEQLTEQKAKLEEMEKKLEAADPAEPPAGEPPAASPDAPPAQPPVTPPPAAPQAPPANTQAEDFSLDGHVQGMGAMALCEGRKRRT
jgi:hypothetical protein